MADLVSNIQIGESSYELVDRTARNAVAAMQTQVNAKADKTTTVNGQALSSNVVLDAEDIGFDKVGTNITATDVQGATEELDSRVTTLEQAPPSGLTASYNSTTETLVFSV